MMLFSILSDEIARKQRRRSDFVSRRRDQKTTRTWELREKRLKLLLAPSFLSLQHCPRLSWQTEYPREIWKSRRLPSGCEKSCLLLYSRMLSELHNKTPHISCHLLETIKMIASCMHSVTEYRPLTCTR